MALPIHSARRVRLGRDQAACFGGHGLARSTSKASAPGQPQQFLLRFGSHEWKTSAAKEIGLTSFESTAGYLRLVHEGLSGSGGRVRIAIRRCGMPAVRQRRGGRKYSHLCARRVQKLHCSAIGFLTVPQMVRIFCHIRRGAETLHYMQRIL